MAIINSAKLYDTFKYVSLIFLPALNVLWLALGSIWGFPMLQEVSLSIAALNAFLGVITGVSSLQHQAETK